MILFENAVDTKKKDKKIKKRLNQELNLCYKPN